MGWKQSVAITLLGLGSNLGIWRILNRLSRARITVLAYHRVADITSADFDTYRSNVSANPQRFGEQMDYVQAYYDVIDLEHLIQWLQGGQDLPARPLLITFDDGYRDVYEHAFPTLHLRGLPALLFVTTGFIGRSSPFYWDRIARGFQHTNLSRISIPGMGDFQWQDAESRARALREIIHLLKSMPNAELEARAEWILQALEIPDWSADAEPLALGWGQIREVAEHGVSIGGHTHSHPILTRIPLEQARHEIRTCIARIRAEIGQPMSAFAYTNGLETDFNREHERILEELGVQVAFSLIPGPTSRAEVRARPLAIRRILINHKDDMYRFEAKLGGATRLARDRL